MTRVERSAPLERKFLVKPLSAVKGMLVLAACLSLAGALTCEGAARGPSRECRYRITSRGFTVGELRTVMVEGEHGGRRAVNFESNLALEADLLFFKTSSTAREVALVGDRGTVSYERSGEENGKASTVHATLKGGAFNFRLVRQGGTCTLSIPRSSFDFTTMDCPETVLKREGDSLQVRLLDMENARVVSRKLRWVKSESVQVGGQKVLCRVVDFEDPDNSCRRWVAVDHYGVLIVRQDGKGRQGSYSLRLVSVSPAP